MKTITVFIASFALASCIPAPKTEFMGPNGKMVYAITCETVNDCEEEALKICPGQHDIVPVASGAADTSAKGAIGDTPVRKLAIECK